MLCFAVPGNESFEDIAKLRFFADTFFNLALTWLLYLPLRRYREDTCEPGE